MEPQDKQQISDSSINPVIENNFNKNISTDKIIGSKKINIIVLVIVFILLVLLGLYLYNKTFKKISSSEGNNQNIPANKESLTKDDLKDNKMENNKTEKISDEELIINSIQQLRKIGIDNDAKALLDYTKKPFELLGKEKDSQFIELFSGLEENLNNPKIKIWNIIQDMTLGMTPEVLKPQMDKCDFREIDDNFPPLMERTASCKFDYLVDLGKINSEKNTYTTVSYRFNFLKISGVWYVDITSINFFDFVSNIKFPKV